MQPFNKDATCPKCFQGKAKEGTVGSQYVAAVAAGTSTPAVPEHMQRVCTFCHYKWDEQMPVAPTE